MGDAMKIARMKELRGIIVKQLYLYLGERVTLSAVKTVLRYKGVYSEEDIKKAVVYLSGEGANYVCIEPDEDEYLNSLVWLTPKGVNLAEGDRDDMGVLLDE